MAERLNHEVLEEEFRCDHESTDFRRKTKSNGVQCWVRQCIHCGEQVGTEVKRELVPGVRRLNPIDFDEHLRQSRWQARQDRATALREEQSTQWWTDYSAYLESPTWKYLRQQVLKRDNFLCQGCLQKRATQVHHLTYERQGREMLFDLTSVCDVCHDRIHDKETRE